MIKTKTQQIKQLLQISIAVILLFSSPILRAIDAPSLDDVRKQIEERLNSGNIMPSIYYSYPHGMTVGLAFYTEDPAKPKGSEDSEDETQNNIEANPYIQIEAGKDITIARAGFIEYSAVGIALSGGLSILKLDKQENDLLYHKKGSYAGIDVSLMFGLAVIRLSYNTPLEKDKKVADKILNLSIGIGLF